VLKEAVALSVSHLARLLESGAYEECLALAAALLAEEGHTREGLARIQAAICRSRLELTDYFAAAEAGKVAVLLADEAGAADLLGAVLIDLATAHGQIRRYDEALEAFQRYLAGLPAYTAARCLEGTALQRMAETLRRAGRPAEALTRVQEARRWFDRFGDAASAVQCARAAIRLHLEQGELAQAVPLLQAGDRHAADHPDDREFLSSHLLDRALFRLAAGEYELASAEAFWALEAAGDRLAQQCRAQLLLAQIALARSEHREALTFALAARVSAIDARAYDLEFEASDLLFRLLRERGERLLREVESDYYRQGVDLFLYISERVVSRLTRMN
jgi:tetratricopeptide (TPR) repeat protein